MVLRAIDEEVEGNEENIVPNNNEEDDGMSSDDDDSSDDSDDYSDIDTDELESGDDEDDNDEEEEEESEGSSVVPKSIKVGGSITDISAHPNSYLLAVSSVQGKKSYANVYKNTPGEKAEQLVKLKASNKMGRSISFSADGSSIYFVSKDNTMRIIDTNTGSINRIVHQIHQDSLPYCMSVVDENLIATGDEDGTIKIWDLRHKDNVAVMSDKRFDHAGVNSLSVDDKHRLLFVLSDNGVMATYNARQRKFLVETDDFEFGLNCAVTMKDNSKLAVGTDEGRMHLYNWDEFAAPSDSFDAASGASIDSMVRVTEDIMFAACDDGCIRAISLLPNKVWKKMEFGSEGDLPQKVIATYDDKYVISNTYHNGIIKFFDVENAISHVDLENREKVDKTWKVEKRVNQHRGTQKAKKRRQKALDAVDPAKRQARADMFADLDSQFKVPDVPDTSSDEEDEEDDQNRKETEKPSSSK